MPRGLQRPAKLNRGRLHEHVSDEHLPVRVAVDVDAHHTRPAIGPGRERDARGAHAARHVQAHLEASNLLAVTDKHRRARLGRRGLLFLDARVLFELVVRVYNRDELHVLDGIRENFGRVLVPIVHRVAVHVHAVAREEQLTLLRARVVVMERVEGISGGGFLVGHDARDVDARALSSHLGDDACAGSRRCASARGANARRRGGQGPHGAHLYPKPRLTSPVPLARFPS